jgi:DNA invertase Pin-like site-specific DNA recombinase
VDFVAYYRVSTSAQQASGLGLEAQRTAVSQFVASRGGRVIGEFEEIESGNVRVRPKLKLAIDQCRRHAATLVIARIDRLARNVLVVASLMESCVDFVAADMPSANKLTIHLIAAVAEHERDMISQRTKVALQAAKARGTVLGNPRIDDARRKAIHTIVSSANEFARCVCNHVEARAYQGLPLNGIARMLTRDGVLTQRGKPWTAAGVRNILSRQRKLRDLQNAR